MADYTRIRRRHDQTAGELLPFVEPPAWGRAAVLRAE